MVFQLGETFGPFGEDPEIPSSDPTLVDPELAFATYFPESTTSFRRPPRKRRYVVLFAIVIFVAGSLGIALNAIVLLRSGTISSPHPRIPYPLFPVRR